MLKDENKTGNHEKYKAASNCVKSPRNIQVMFANDCLRSSRDHIHYTLHIYNPPIFRVNPDHYFPLSVDAKTLLSVQAYTF